MRTLVRRVSSIPHGGLLYLERPVGQQAVLWLDEGKFTAADADYFDKRLNSDFGQKSAGPAQS